MPDYFGTKAKPPSDTKICSTCKVEKDKEEFHHSIVGRRHSLCKPCLARYKKRQRERKKLLLAEDKLEEHFDSFLDDITKLDK